MIDDFTFDQVRRCAEVSFRDHEVRELEGGKEAFGWYCAKPGTLIHSFTVVCTPDATHLSGDIGALGLKGPWGWVAGSVDNPAYLLGRSIHPCTEFDPEAACRMLQPSHDDDSETWDWIREHWYRVNPEDERLFHDVYFDHEGDYIDVRVATGEALMCYFALKWLAERPEGGDQCR